MAKFTLAICAAVSAMATLAPFVTIPYGLGNGWTPGSGR